jgi:hypothetical protein
MSTEATSPQPSNNSTSAAYPAIKVATPDLFVFKDDILPEQLMVDLIFEDIGGHELITLSRNDLISGQTISYQPIKNISSLYLQYNPQNILNLQDTSVTIFKNFPIKIEKSLPLEGTGPGKKTVYLNSGGDLVIEVVNLEPDEQIDVQILISGELLSGTIYEGTI